MKTLTLLLILAFSSFHLLAAEPAPKAKPKKPSATVEAMVKTLTPQQQGQLLSLLNKGDKQALLDIPGVGETRAAAILKGRPYENAASVMRVEGVGEGTFAKIVSHVKAGAPK